MQPTLLRALASAALLILVALMSASPASAAQARRTFSATVTGGGASGSAVLVMYPNNSGVITISLNGLSPNTTFTQQIYKGTCSKPVTLVKLSTIRTNASGHGARIISLQPRIAAAVWSVGAAGVVAYRVAAGSFVRCATLRYPVATRVLIANYGIDLPIVYQPPKQYPYCNVAMYSADLSQPGEAGPTMIYAHARTGMFLPLLTASKVRNGAAMLGMTVKVWTSDTQLYIYKVTRVARNAYGFPSNDFTAEQLWLQTSEGPRGTPHKLFVLAKRISAEETSYADAHPTPHIVVCH